MVGRSKTRRYYYNCPNHNSTAGSNKCLTKSVNADYIENYILDLVVEIINKNNLSRELAVKQKDLITYYTSIIAKNKQILQEKTKTFDAIVSKSMSVNNQLILNQFEKRLEKVSVEIDEYEKKINAQELIVNNLKTKSISPIISKAELLTDRKVAQSVIKEVVESIIVDEKTGEITIKMY